ncbi:MAG: cation transporter [Ruminococcus sp.]|nr:cation transporter [Ruminococcus sp.]
MINTQKDLSRDRVIIRTSVVGIAANVFLASFKAVIGLLSHSIAIVLDAVNNISDAGSSLITIIGTKLAGKQPDKKHPWGHGRIEYISAMLISVIILYAGVTSFVESVKKIVKPDTPDYSAAALVIVASAVLVKIVLGRYVKGVGEKVNSDSLVNSGTDAMMDSVISASTLVAAVIYLLFHIRLEAWLGAVISVFIIKSGVEMLRDTISHLLGQRVGAETAAAVKKSITEIPQVMGVYDLIFHDYGPDRLNCSAHIEVADTLTADQIDSIQREATMKLYTEQNIILTALSVYSVNTQDEEIKAFRKEIYSIAMSVDHVIQVHGFYLHKDTNVVQFDVIVDFDAKDRNEVFSRVLSLVQEKFPQYKFLCTLDTDFSVSE